jgi:hypothetical protein
MQKRGSWIAHIAMIAVSYVEEAATHLPVIMVGATTCCFCPLTSSIHPRVARRAIFVSHDRVCLSNAQQRGCCSRDP